jgi:hypothetical protein
VEFQEAWGASKSGVGLKVVSSLIRFLKILVIYLWRIHDEQNQLESPTPFLDAPHITGLAIELVDKGYPPDELQVM